MSATLAPAGSNLLACEACGAVSRRPSLRAGRAEVDPLQAAGEPRLLPQLLNQEKLVLLQLAAVRAQAPAFSSEASREARLEAWATPSEASGDAKPRPRWVPPRGVLSDR